MVRVTPPLRISIVTPAFNSRETILDTIESISSQQYPDVEHIVMDGGSADGTTDVLRSNESKLAFWTSEPDDGQYDAISKGLNVATGDVLGWLNADDMLMPGALHAIGRIFRSFPEVKWISSLQPGRWDTDGFLAGFDSVPGFSHDAFLDGLYLPGTRAKGYWIQQESTFWRRELWTPAAAKAMKSCQLAGDFALWAHFFASHELVGVEYPLGGFRNRAGQKSQDIERYIAEARVVLQRAQSTRTSRGRRSAPFLYLNSRGLLSVSKRLERAVERRFGYSAKRVRNADLREPGGRWVLENIAFMP